MSFTSYILQRKDRTISMSWAYIQVDVFLWVFFLKLYYCSCFVNIIILVEQRCG